MAEQSPSNTLVEREIAAAIETALADTRVVLVVGPRQAGKTTLVRQFVQRDRPYVTLDDSGALSAARADPTGFIRGLRGAVIDEVQRAPKILLAIKVAVDDDPAPGRYLLTGSANVMALPLVGDSLAGRVELITLLPFAQCELRGQRGRFVDRMFSGESLSAEADPVLGDALVELVLAGGYPEALTRQTIRRRSAWFDDYLRLILDRDVRDITTIEQLDRLPALVSLLGEQAGQLSNITNISTALQLARPTVARYIEVLDRLFLVKLIPPWHSNRTSRLIKAPKVQFLDSGLLGARLDLNPDAIRRSPERFGPVLETFVFAELSKLLSWSDTRATISHFRTKENDEVDFVLEDSRGRIVGIEVKASATLRRNDFSGLRKLEAAAGEKFVRGIVLHDHDRVTPISDKLHGAPLSLLWSS